MFPPLCCTLLRVPVDARPHRKLFTVHCGNSMN
jgi:hypothetical protein